MDKKKVYHQRLAFISSVFARIFWFHLNFLENKCYRGIPPSGSLQNSCFCRLWHLQYPGVPLHSASTVYQSTPFLYAPADVMSIVSHI